MIGANPHRQVLTFYSFKGGVGRTMALANIAYRLAFHHGLHVIAVDWDLEAPGLQSFFRLPSDTLKNARGLLDYCEIWESAYREQAPELPDPLSYLVPVEPERKEETHGSLRLLLAGKQDEQYDARLGRFDWKRFYAESAGAGAVEHLRSRLTENADLILVDSRTGLTDPGGICTIQIPDAAVLMTAPNNQSLEGIKRIALSIATATPEARVGRGTARVFLCMSRVPMVEETYQAREWFKAHEPWFKDGMEAGLWRAEDHQQGLETHVIPQRGTYGFNESLVGRAVGTLEREPLAQAYDALTRMLLRWKWENVWRGNTISDTDIAAKLAQTKKDVARARKSRNARDLILALGEYASALRQAAKLSEALEVTQEAVALVEPIHEPFVVATIYFEHSLVLLDLEQYATARDAAQVSLLNAERTQDPKEIEFIRVQLGYSLIMSGQEQDGTQLLLKAIADLRARGNAEEADKALAILYGAQFVQDLTREKALFRERNKALTRQIISQLRQTITLTQKLGDIHKEAAETRELLKHAEKAGVKLPDEVQLRDRLKELGGPAQSAAPLRTVKPKRSRSKGKTSK